MNIRYIHCLMGTCRYCAHGLQMWIIIITVMCANRKGKEKWKTIEINFKNNFKIVYVCVCVHVFISIIQMEMFQTKANFKNWDPSRIGRGSVWLSNGVVFGRSTDINYNHGMYVYYMIVMTEVELNESDIIDRNSKENPTRRVQSKSVQKKFFYLSLPPCQFSINVILRVRTTQVPSDTINANLTHGGYYYGWFQIKH